MHAYFSRRSVEGCKLGDARIDKARIVRAQAEDRRRDCAGNKANRSMIVKSQFKAWKWKFQRQHIFELPFSVGGLQLSILSGSGNPLVIAYKTELKIRRHYHFDGATWAPDFKRVLYASALHDALLQLAEKYPEDITEAMAHEAFKVEMKARGFKLWPIYYYAVSSWPRKLYKRLTAKG